MSMESNAFRESDHPKSGATLGKLTELNAEAGKKERNLDERTKIMTEMDRSKQHQEYLPGEKLGKLPTINTDSRSNAAFSGDSQSDFSRLSTTGGGLGRLEKTDESVASELGGGSKQVGVVSVSLYQKRDKS